LARAEAAAEQREAAQQQAGQQRPPAQAGRAGGPTRSTVDRHRSGSPVRQRSATVYVVRPRGRRAAGGILPVPKRRLPTATPWFVLAGVLLLAALVASQVEVRRPPRPHGSVDDLARLAARDDVSLLFVLIDTLRADHLHGYGYPRETSPAIDALAATGVRFAHVVAQSSWTKTSMASLWTSTWPRRH